MTGTGTRAETHRDEAILALAAGDHDDAGDRYTRAAYADAAGHAEVAGDPLAPDERGRFARGVVHHLLAAVAYRVAGGDDRMERRAAQARHLARDARERSEHPIVEAACAELVADAHAVAGDLGAATDAYDRAEREYADAAPGNPTDWATRPLCQHGTDLVTQLSRPDDLAWDDVHGSDPDGALGRRVDFKRRRLPSLVAARVDAGQLFAPRGSTEYGTDFRCPNCGAADVNYVAEAVLCLRCNALLERR